MHIEKKFKVLKAKREASVREKYMNSSSEVISKVKANPVAYKCCAKLAARNGLKAEDAISDLSTLMETQGRMEKSDVPSIEHLTPNEKTMNFADLIQHKMSVSKDCSKDELDRQVRNLQ